MQNLFQKLNLTTQERILIADPPDSFSAEMESLHGIEIESDIKACQGVTFALIFVMQKAAIDQFAKLVAKHFRGDAIVWFAYPKGSSKKYHADFNRDNGWDSLRMLGFDTVRQVAIDEDWSALRFRRVEYIGGKR